jgi:hypothetical protein
MLIAINAIYNYALILSGYGSRPEPALSLLPHERYMDWWASLEISS